MQRCTAGCRTGTFLSYTLRSAGKLALIYGSFAGQVATLVLLYASAVTLIFGAEINAVTGERAADRSDATPPAGSRHGKITP